jgi:hypothetical protein
VSTLDLNSPPPGHKYSVAIDPEETPWERALRLFKDVALFLFAIAVVATILLVCYHTVTSTTAAADEKNGQCRCYQRLLVAFSAI